MNKRNKFRLYFALTQVLFWFAAPCAAQVRDFWLKTQRNGTDFAREHIVVRPLENGGFEYRSDSHTKLNVLGVKQDIRESRQHPYFRTVEVVSYPPKPASFAEKPVLLRVSLG